MENPASRTINPKGESNIFMGESIVSVDYEHGQGNAYVEDVLDPCNVLSSSSPLTF